MDYLKFYELTSEPFQNHPDPAVYYVTQAQQRARLRILRGLEQQRGLAVVIGPAGCGKTTLATHLASSLPSDRFEVHTRVISHSACANGWLLPEVARAIGTHDVAGDPARTIALIQQALLLRRASGVHPVLMMDEAQMLASAAVMQEFRALLNLAQAGRPLLSLVLFGLMELKDVLALDPSLAQRIEVRVELTPMGNEEIAGYVAHRLKCAGGAPDLFTADAIEALRRYSRGVPRILNTLADNALFEASLSEVRPVTAESVIAAADQLSIADAPTTEPTWIPLAATDASELAVEATSAEPSRSRPVTGVANRSGEQHRMVSERSEASHAASAQMQGSAAASDAAPQQAPAPVSQAPSDASMSFEIEPIAASLASETQALHAAAREPVVSGLELASESVPSSDSDSSGTSLDLRELGCEANTAQAHESSAVAAVEADAVDASGAAFDLELAVELDSSDTDAPARLEDEPALADEDEPDTADAISVFTLDEDLEDASQQEVSLEDSADEVTAHAHVLQLQEIPLDEPAAIEPMSDDAEADALFEAVLQPEPSAPAKPAIELKFEDPADAALASLEAAKPVPATPADDDDDDLIDMADFLELDVEQEPPAAAAKTAAAPAPLAEAGDAGDGDLDDLFEQIQLED